MWLSRGEKMEKALKNLEECAMIADVPARPRGRPMRSAALENVWPQKTMEVYHYEQV